MSGPGPYPVPDGWAHLPFFARDWPRIRAALAAETRQVLPPPGQVFRALGRVPPGRVRVVILGQDPYPRPGQGNGLAFSLDPALRPSPSLRRIFDEVARATGRRPAGPDLSPWAEQGVLLLNTALTVPAGASGGHARLGWDALARQVIAEVSTRPTAFLLWGVHARAYRPEITGAGHLILEAGHPSPLNRAGDFAGCDHFGQVDRWHAARGETPIRWA